MVDLLDASVWLPLSAPDHVHHDRARSYWESEAADRVAFCRITALALLRHLSSPRVIGASALDGPGAWRALATWLALPEVVMLSEQPGVDEFLAGWSADMNLRSGHWTDAYLAAFARASGCRLVTFDGDFRRYRGLDCLRLG